jgi:hypothetical protein
LEDHGMTPKQIRKLPGGRVMTAAEKRALGRFLDKEYARQAAIIVDVLNKVSEKDRGVVFDGAEISDDESEGLFLRADGSIGGYPKSKKKGK